MMKFHLSFIIIVSFIKIFTLFKKPNCGANCILPDIFCDKKNHNILVFFKTIVTTLFELFSKGRNRKFFY